ncbi:MAG: hypothetical protein JWQ71_4843 [Pedosphaera sp.]|nr:hypothetical protein [Pedosphaera sp.]
MAYAMGEGLAPLCGYGWGSGFELVRASTSRFELLDEDEVRAFLRRLLSKMGRSYSG